MSFLESFESICNEISRGDRCCKISELIFRAAEQKSKDKVLEEKIMQLNSLLLSKPFQLFLPLAQDIFPKNVSVKEPPIILLMAHEMTRTGAPVVLQDMAIALQEMNYRVLFAAPKDGPLRRELIKKGVPVIVDSTITDFDDREGGIVQQLIQEVHFSVANTLITGPVIARNIGLNNQIFWWLHEGEESFNYVGHLVPRDLTDNIHVLFGGEYVRSQMIKKGIHYQGKIFLYGTRNLSRKTEKEKKDKLCFICAGTFCRRKGQDVLLRAIAELTPEEMKCCEFWFVGFLYDFGIKTTLEKMMNKFPNIHMEMEMEREKLYELYENMDAIICPSRDDPMPVVVTENMSLENICICSSNTGTAGLLEDGVNGLIFQSENVDMLAEKIRYVLSHQDELGQMRKNSRKLFLEVLEMEVFKEKLQELINDL